MVCLSVAVCYSRSVIIVTLRGLGGLINARWKACSEQRSAVDVGSGHTTSDTPRIEFGRHLAMHVNGGSCLMSACLSQAR